MRKISDFFFVLLALNITGCIPSQEMEKKMKKDQSFIADVQFLQKHRRAIVLENSGGRAKVLVVPDFQGRVMTSTAEGAEGPSLGWINYELIASGEIQKHINAFGGEDRFWLGPEGGQFSIFFKKDDPFDLEHWQTPPQIDSEPFFIVEQSMDRVLFKKEMELKNYSNTVFKLKASREIAILDKAAVEKNLGLKIDQAVKSVAFESVNSIENIGKEQWTRETGLLSIWILGMFKPSDETTVVLPLSPGTSESGVNDNYFGKVPSDRLKVDNNAVFFKGDGQFRSKIGVAPHAAKPVMGSYDAINGVLTIVQFSFDDGAVDYVNSAWEMQDKPYAGDVTNSYNDGPPTPGAKALGPFYELETSSAAKELLPGGILNHVHRTYHFIGTEEQLSEISSAILGLSVQAIKVALK